MTANLPTSPLPPAWAAQSSEIAEDVDEPPEKDHERANRGRFQRTAVRKPAEQPSLLTQAIMAQSDDDYEDHSAMLIDIYRRRSTTSNVSVASTADLTSDTGLTSPARTNTPSPPLPDIAILRLDGNAQRNTNDVAVKDRPTPLEGPRKRCIQFACVAKPMMLLGPEARPTPMVKAPSADGAPRRSCIKFACTTRPASTQNTPPRHAEKSNALAPMSTTKESPSTPKKHSPLTTTTPQTLSPRPVTLRRSPGQTFLTRPRYLRADSKDLVNDGSQFHEFASGVTREDDWIRQENSPAKAKLTINDTLQKENTIRRLATEAEEEAELEDEAEEAAIDEDGNCDDDEDDDEDDGVDDVNDSDHEPSDSDGYHTDEETGFADSDSEEEEDENMVFWTPGRAVPAVQQTSNIPHIRRPTLHEQHSDSSTATTASKGSARRPKMLRPRRESEPVDLPDSTDFVCGTLDEDRPLEEAYLSCLAARRNEKLRVIPQDIDPSFPASEPEDDDDEVYAPVNHDSDENVWMQGEMEDLHHDQERSRRRRKSEHASPRKYHSPPPKRHHSPAPRAMARGRSPKPLFDRLQERHSPRRNRSPAPKFTRTPTGSPRIGGQVGFQLGGRPGLTQTKSLPRPAALFRTSKAVRTIAKISMPDDVHVRGAIDIVKGLEKKRQRRKEKFHQKYCDRARRGQIPERKPLPGKGAERMKELGLLMAGKKDPGNYVLSV